MPAARRQRERASRHDSSPTPAPSRPAETVDEFRSACVRARALLAPRRPRRTDRAGVSSDRQRVFRHRRACADRPRQPTGALTDGRGGDASRSPQPRRMAADCGPAPGTVGTGQRSAPDGPDGGAAELGGLERRRFVVGVAHVRRRRHGVRRNIEVRLRASRRKVVDVRAKKLPCGSVFAIWKRKRGRRSGRENSARDRTLAKSPGRARRDSPTSGAIP